MGAFCAVNTLAVITSATNLSLFTVKCLLAMFLFHYSVLHGIHAGSCSAKGESNHFFPFLSLLLNHCLLNQCNTINTINNADLEKKQKSKRKTTLPLAPV